MKRGTHVAIRLCMGCGERSPQPELLRVAPTPDGALALLAKRSHTGRTGYLHRQPTCWDRFASRQGPVRSLGRKVDKATRNALVEELKFTEQSAIRG